MKTNNLALNILNKTYPQLGGALGSKLLDNTFNNNIGGVM